MYVILAYKIKDSSQWVECVCSDKLLAEKTRDTYEDSDNGGIRYSVFEAELMTEINYDELTKKSKTS